MLSCEIISVAVFMPCWTSNENVPADSPVCMHRIFRYALMALTCCSMRSSVVLSVILRFSPSSCRSAMNASSSASKYRTASAVSGSIMVCTQELGTIMRFLPRMNSRWKLSNTVSSARSVSVQFA